MIYDESWLMMNFDWWGNLIDGESWLMNEVDWWGKLIDKDSWLMNSQIEESKLEVIS